MHSPCGSAEGSIKVHTHSCMCTHKNVQFFLLMYTGLLKHKYVMWCVGYSDAENSTSVMQQFLYLHLFLKIRTFSFVFIMFFSPFLMDWQDRNDLSSWLWVWQKTNKVAPMFLWLLCSQWLLFSHMLAAWLIITLRGVSLALFHNLIANITVFSVCIRNDEWKLSLIEENKVNNLVV